MHSALTYSKLEVIKLIFTISDYHYEKRTNKCYKFHNKPKTFMPAFFTCSAEGGHLAIINNEEELKVINEIHALYPPSKITGHNDKYSAFLGFYYEEDVGDWTTIHGDSILALIIFASFISIAKQLF